ncbi:hypothetical protein PC9H_004555 [Pleurotus ostreatus]|uniref:Neutral protease 2 n=1 Tax=Pleurotus ostreatus TaxID=5322 RepID=A0A8H6ZYT4_PLEOS|nr:uncharacterized protein PC9H_004555 [Pleurotus ostreatus]KAF7432613.1 hypothetical protein PC9H_004555 [Pleurotus ostreatus]
MFVWSFVTLGLASAALASPFKRSGGLSVKLSAAAVSVESIDDLKLVAEVTNTGSEDVKVLKYGTVLDDKLPTRIFTVTKDGSTVPFTGIKIQLSLADADDTAYTVIPAGQTVTVSHAVAPLFDFASVGAGKFTFEPVTTFQVAGAAERVANIDDLTKVDATVSAVDVEVTADVAKREIQARNKRAVDICTTSSRKSFIDARHVSFSTTSLLRLIYFRGASDSLYRAYFGATATSRVTSILNAVANENSGSRTLSCTDSFGACSSGVIAYTVISTTNIYFCSIFFNEVATPSLCSGTSVASRNIRGGTTLHEMTHAVAGTDDIGYGCSFDQSLSDSQSIANADNFNCFTTQVYANTRC